MNRRLLPMIALAFLAASPAPVTAAARPGPNRPLQKAIAELGLTPAQRRQLLQLRRARRPEQMLVTRQIRVRRQELAALYGTYPLDEAKAAKYPCPELPYNGAWPAIRRADGTVIRP